ncbi:MAG: ABC transporter ATP-binding protein [Alphaproteobacteria bacterium]|nr:ABC transporter ATP-binding protein [Alphaproteobacteria bacterium]TAD91412.1 MAG: ABC transporter ATP-binding protein [Alphaproteobacteria bacterium]
MTDLLVVDGVSRSFRGLRAVSEVGFTVPEGGIVGLIGPNGAGKTTCFNLIAGVLRPDQGDIRFAGRSLIGLRPDQIAAAGIGRTFQIVRPFPELTVRQNVTVGALLRHRRVADAEAAADAVLSRLELATKADRHAGSLTLPDRKRLEVARALATNPRLLLLDEVMAGLRPTEIDAMVAILVDLNRTTGLTILLIEHVMRAVMALCQHIVVLHHGELIAAGPPAAIQSNPTVIGSYLGEEALG